MKKTSQTMLFVTAFLERPATIEEFNSFCKGTDTVLDYAVAEAYYRTVAPKVRAKFLERVEKLTGIAPRVISTKTVKSAKTGDEKTVDIMEKDTVYMKHVLANGWTAEQLAPELQASFDEVGWDLTSTRSSGPNAKDKETAKAILAKIANGGTTWERVLAKFVEWNTIADGQFELEDGALDEDTLSEICKLRRLQLEDISSDM